MDQVLGVIILLTAAFVLLLTLLTTMLVRGVRRPPRHTAGYAIGRGVPVDPEEIGLDFEAWTVDCPDGVQLPVWEIDLRNGRSDAATQRRRGLTAIFVHGWGQSRIDMLGRLGPWPELCDRLVLYDLRGHGDAESSLSRLASHEERDLVALLERLGDGPVVLVGWSLGATIAINAVLGGGEAASRVRGIVAYGPYEEFNAALHGKLRSLGYPTRPITDLAIAWLALRGMRPPSLGAAVSDLECPLLVVHGEQDAISPLAGARLLAERAPEGELHLIVSAAHADQHLAGEEDHDEVIREFMDRVGRGLGPDYS